jgi:hypothetical protein
MLRALISSALGKLGCRVLFVAQGGSLAWRETSHSYWPDSFKCAVRTLLLAASGSRGPRRPYFGCCSKIDSRCSISSIGASCLPLALLRQSESVAASHVAAGRIQQGTAGLHALPVDIMLDIITLSAAPMSAWL